jgi:thioredoxin 1
MFVKDKGLTIVDVWAPWCGPCKQMHRVLDEIQKERKDTHVEKVNIDLAEDDPYIEKFVRDNSIKALPTLFFYKDGKQLSNKTHIGATTKTDILNILDSINE